MAEEVRTESVPAIGDTPREQYNAVVASAELSDIKMIRLNFELKPKFFELAASPEGLSPKAEFNSTFKDNFFEKESGFLACQILWSAKMKSGRSTLVSIEALYLVGYDGVAPVEEEHAFAFVQRVGRFATYPYYRALVSRLSAESGLNLPPLPVLK